MQIIRNGRPTAKGPAEWFTGDVYIDELATALDSSGFAAGCVHFAPGARTAWHRHPRGQSLVVMEGVCRCQRRGGPVETLSPGDRVVFEPNEEHWHGAAPDRFMIHIAMQGVDEQGTAAYWGEHVTDDEYNAGSLGDR